MREKCSKKRHPKKAEILLLLNPILSAVQTCRSFEKLIVCVCVCEALNAKRKKDLSSKQKHKPVLAPTSYQQPSPFSQSLSPHFSKLRILLICPLSPGCCSHQWRLCTLATQMSWSWVPADGFPRFISIGHALFRGRTWQDMPRASCQQELQTSQLSERGERA